MPRELPPVLSSFVTAFGLALAELLQAQQAEDHLEEVMNEIYLVVRACLLSKEIDG